jgi:hypothetical protein
VIDYWPDSREATLAAYLIASAFRSIGETEDGMPVKASCHSVSSIPIA